MLDKANQTNISYFAPKITEVTLTQKPQFLLFIQNLQKSSLDVESRLMKVKPILLLIFLIPRSHLINRVLSTTLECVSSMVETQLISKGGVIVLAPSICCLDEVIHKKCLFLTSMTLGQLLWKLLSHFFAFSKRRKQQPRPILLHYLMPQITLPIVFDLLLRHHLPLRPTSNYLLASLTHSCLLLPTRRPVHESLYVKRRQTGIFQHLFLLFEFLEGQLLQRYRTRRHQADRPLLNIGKDDLLGEDKRLQIGHPRFLRFIHWFVSERGIAGMGGIEGACEGTFHGWIILLQPQSPDSSITHQFQKIIYSRQIKIHSPIPHSSHSCHHRHRNCRCLNSTVGNCSEESHPKLISRTLARTYCFTGSCRAEIFGVRAGGGSWNQAKLQGRYQACLG